MTFLPECGTDKVLPFGYNVLLVLQTVASLCESDPQNSPKKFSLGH